MDSKRMVTRDFTSAAIQTLAGLDRDQFPIAAAFISPDEDGTKYLFIFSGLVDLLGPRAAYSRLQNVLRGVSGGVPLQLIRLLSGRRPEVNALRATISVPVGSSIHFRNSNMNGIFFEDMTLLRTPPL